MKSSSWIYRDQALYCRRCNCQNAKYLLFPKQAFSTALLPQSFLCDYHNRQLSSRLWHDPVLSRSTRVLLPLPKYWSRISMHCDGAHHESDGTCLAGRLIQHHIKRIALTGKKYQIKTYIYAIIYPKDSSILIITI